jgi:hypothetical protein
MVHQETVKAIAALRCMPDPSFLVDLARSLVDRDH